MTIHPDFDGKPRFVYLTVNCIESAWNKNRIVYLWDKNIGDELPVDREIARFIPEYVIVSDDATCVVSGRYDGEEEGGYAFKCVTLEFYYNGSRICKHGRSREDILHEN